MNKTRKTIVTIIIFMTILIIFILLINIINKDYVKRKLDGVVISKETGEVLDYVTLTINGKLKKGKDTPSMLLFGEFSLSSIKYTQNVNASLIYNIGSNKENNNILTYPLNIWENGELVSDVAICHSIEVGHEFSYVVLGNYEDNYVTVGNEKTDRIFNGTSLIVFPAHDATSAFKLIEDNNLSKNIFNITTKEDF